MIWRIKKKLYRVQQKVMKIISLVIPFPTPTLLIGAGSIKQLAENIRTRGCKNILLVSDKVLMDLKLADGLLESLKKNEINYVIYDEVKANPTIENIENGREIYRKNKCDGIIAFGGGSPIDCAKVIGARISNPYLSVRAMKGLFRVFLPIPPFFCVPTTAGTGSEATVAAVITDASTHKKFIISDLKLIPKVAVLDPELMVGLPPDLTSTTGMDALTHAVEAYIGLNGSAFTDKNAENATKLIFDNLEEAYQNGFNLDARENMALASFYAGAAFTRAYVGYVHAIAHTMGGLYGVAHGLANAIILPYILDFCREEAEEKLASLAIAGGIGSRSESNEILSYGFIEKIKTMNQKMEIPSFVKELQAKDIPLIAKRVLDEAHPDYPVPRIMTLGECEALLKKLLKI